MPQVIVLGGGMIGSVAAVDLAGDDDLAVTVADVRPDALARCAVRAEREGRRLRTIEADLADPAAVRRLVEPFDLAVGALGSDIGHAGLRAVLEAGVDICDVCFMGENALDLNDIARESGTAAVIDMGVAPGMSNLLAGAAHARMERCESIEIHVGGLPVERRWPFEYKAAFSPRDVIEEYTRPARLVEHGRVVTREALSEPESIDFPGVGTLEAFNTDGLRSLLFTLRDVPTMKEKTLRYPGHAELMRIFRETGLFSTTPIGVPGGRVRPLDVISTLMFPKWMYEDGEADLTVMRVVAAGRENGEQVRYEWNLADAYDPQTGTTSMARTTAFPCAIVARLMARGALREAGFEPGVLAPEHLGRDGQLVDMILDALAVRGVRYGFSRTVVGDSRGSSGPE